MADDRPQFEWSDYNGSTGIACPECGYLLSYVQFTRKRTDGILRRRICRNKSCMHGFTTYETSAKPRKADDD